ncbi:hypothetical protein ACNJX9_04425 [Bradyrhizobium sp. DASA03076]|uniref:hypothetical protein n=1 Tax=Bradyrhizobium sp. BLXBL-03 TaxID=3395916 RepID=UPI003F6F0DF5
MGIWLIILSPWIALFCLILWDVYRAELVSRSAEVSPTSNPVGVSDDFAALIDTLRQEGRALRREEQREDRGKKFREWVTIIVITMTLIAVCYQVYEMIKVYEPIKQQADAAKDAADATERAADAATRQSEIASRQAESSDKAMLQAQRAWIGPRDTRLEAKPAAGQKNKAIVEYQNTGKEPALAFVYDVAPVLATAAEDTDGTLARVMTDFMWKCVGIQPRPLAGVVFPTSGFSSSQLSLPLDEKFMDADVEAGKKTLLIQGCFAYQTGNATHHSAFCYFYNANRSDFSHLNVCSGGNHAD